MRDCASKTGAETNMAWGKPSPDDAADKPAWLPRLEKNDPTLTSLHVLRFRPFDEALQVATAKALEENDSLVEFYASGHRVSGVGAEAWAKMLAINVKLQSLCIGDDEFGSTLEEGGEMSALDVVLKGLAHSATMEKIDLEYKGVRDASGEAIGRFMSQCGSLKEVRLGRNDKLSETGYRAVFAGASEGGSLEALDLSDSKLDDGSARALADVLRSTCPIKTLGLTRCELTGDGLAALGSGLAKCDQLRHLELSGVKLGNGGADACFSQLAGEKLRVSEGNFVQCGISEPRDVQGLDAFLCANSELTNVNLRGNEFGDDGLAHLSRGAFAAHTPASIDFGSCGITSSGMECLKFALTGSTSLSLFDNPKLGDDGVAKLFDAARESSVTMLDLGAVGLSAAGLEAMVKSFGDDLTFPNLRTLVIGGNPGAQEDAWEGLVNNLRAIRPALDVAWRAADGGDDSKLQRDDSGRVTGVEK